MLFVVKNEKNERKTFVVYVIFVVKKRKEKKLCELCALCVEERTAPRSARGLTTNTDLRYAPLPLRANEMNRTWVYVFSRTFPLLFFEKRIYPIKGTDTCHANIMRFRGVTNVAVS